MADSTSSTPAGLTPATTATSSVVNANAPAVKLPLAARKDRSSLSNLSVLLLYIFCEI